MQTLSYTRWALYHKCPRSYLLDEQRKAQVDASKFIVGRAVHTLAETWDGALGQMLAGADDCLRATLNKANLNWSGARYDKELARAKKLVIALEEPLRPIIIQDCKREEWVRKTVLGVKLRGPIDILVPGVIYDIKTSTDTKWLKVDQLLFYAWLAGDIEVGVFITPAMKKKLHYHRMYPAKLAEVELGVTKAIEGIRKQQFEPVITPGCGQCDYRQWCVGRAVPAQ